MTNSNRDVPRAPAWRRYLTFWRTPIMQDVDDELRFHMNMRIKELMARGLAEAEARRAVAERLGDLEAAKSECVELSEVRERNKRNAALLDAARNDLRYAIRGLRARPGFAAVIIVTLGLGIGANAAVFSVVDRLLFRTAPMLRDASRTHRIYVSYPSPDGEGTFTRDVISYARYRQIGETSGSFARTAAYGVSHSIVGGPEEGRDMQVAGVSASFFSFFDAPPRLGRYFNPREDRPPAGDPVVVLSYAMWLTAYGGRDDALGATVQIGQTAYTVIGVAPRSFVGLWSDEPPIAYIPFAAYAGAMNYAGRGDTWWTSKDFDIAGLLVTRKPGVSVEMATTELTHEMREHWNEGHSGPISVHRPSAIVASTLVERGPNPTFEAKVGALVGAMALVVLVIAGANVASLLLARALRRRREIAVRLALGISRARLVSQLITETLLLAVAGGVAGLTAAKWGGPALRAKLMSPSADTAVVTDVRTLIFVGLAVLLAGVATGLAPAWQAGRLDVTRFLRIGAREGVLQRSRLRASLLVVQAALSVVLLVAAGLFVRTLDKVRHLHMGYDLEPTLVVKVDMRGVRLDSARREDLWQRLTTAARTAPNVDRAAAAMAIPLLDIAVANIKRPPEIDSLRYAKLFILQNVVMPGYFATIGTHIVRGRALDSTDAAGAPRAMVVSSRLAQTFWPGQDPIGRCVMNARGVCAYVVGVAEDIRNLWSNEDPGLELYTSALQQPLRHSVLFVRTNGDAKRYAEGLRAALQREMPGASYVTVTPFADIFGNGTQSWRLGATVFVAFGVLAMLLAAIGLYSAISYNVTQRTHEMGVRRALGAQAADVIQLVMRQGLLLGGIGVLLGGVLAFLAADRIEPLLFNVSARDPFVFMFVIIAMLCVAIAASFIPARRAALVDPNVALRSE
jgi:predicted permease